MKKLCWDNNLDSRIESIENLKNQKYVCFCNEVTFEDIVVAVSKGANTLKKIIVDTGAMKNPNCNKKNPKGICCSGDILMILNYILSEK